MQPNTSVQCSEGLQCALPSRIGPPGHCALFCRCSCLIRPSRFDDLPSLGGCMCFPDSMTACFRHNMHTLFTPPACPLSAGAALCALNRILDWICHRTVAGRDQVPTIGTRQGKHHPYGQDRANASRTCVCHLCPTKALFHVTGPYAHAKPQSMLPPNTSIQRSGASRAIIAHAAPHIEDVPALR